MKMNKKGIVCYNTDASRLVGNAERVVFPKSAGEVQKIVKGADLDIVPRGAGSSLVGGAIPNNSIVVDLGNLNRVLNFDKEKKTVYAEAGVTLKELNERLNKVGFEFPIYPFNHEISTIGGMVAVNALGNRSVKYGMMRDWIEEIDFINGRGELMKIVKNDLMDVCGMEGITGIIVGAKLKVIPKIKRSASIFQTENIDEALSIARRLKLEQEVIMLEFLCPEISKLLRLSEKYHIIIEFDSDRGKIKGREYEELLKLSRGVYYTFASNGYHNSEDPKFFFDKIKDFILFLEERKIPYFGYLGMGIIFPFFKDDDKKEEVIKLIGKTNTKPNGYGIGLSRKYLIDNFEAKIIQRVKLRHDPFLKMNKGKILDVDSYARPRERKAHKVESVLDEKEREKKDDNKFEREETASGLIEELKTPEEKIDEFIENVKGEENIEKIKEEERGIEEEPGIDDEIKEKLLDYEKTFTPKLVERRRKDVEQFAKNVAREIVSSGIVDVKEIDEDGKKESVDYKSIQDIMTNRYAPGELKVTVTDNLDRKEIPDDLEREKGGGNKFEEKEDGSKN